MSIWNHPCGGKSSIAAYKPLTSTFFNHISKEVASAENSYGRVLCP